MQTSKIQNPQSYVCQTEPEEMTSLFLLVPLIHLKVLCSFPNLCATQTLDSIKRQKYVTL